MPRFPHLLLALALFASILTRAQSPPTRPYIITAYVFPRGAALTPDQIDPSKLTRINYAFSNIEAGRMVPGSPSDAQNFALLRSLRNTNPNLTILVSVGGWLGSTNFSDMALTRDSRTVFEDSVMQFLTRFDLDGLDIDWEYPGRAGFTNHFRPEDKQNYTALLAELQTAFARQSRTLHRRLYLTIAAGASPDFLDHTEMRKVARIVDTVNLMAYDYYEPGSGPLTGHHAPLFTNPRDPEKVSADASVRAFEQAGVPASKLLLGLPFYGHVWADVPPKDDGLYQPGKPAPQTGAPFSTLPSMLENGFVRHWDSVSDVPWLYNPSTRTFVSYEDPQSIALKCQYVRTHRLAGIMVWDLEDDDPSGTLLKALDACAK
jgi:chitinase